MSKQEAIQVLSKFSDNVYKDLYVPAKREKLLAHIYRQYVSLDWWDSVLPEEDKPVWGVPILEKKIAELRRERQVLAKK